MALIRRREYYNPFSELEKLQTEMNKLFNDFSWGRDSEATGGLLDKAWAPAVDIYDNKDNYIVKADLPGLTKEDIDVSIHNNTLVIKGEKKQESNEKKDNFIRSERFFGSFSRSFVLPTDIDATKVKAEHKEGILNLTLPKKEEAKPKQITVEVK